MGHEHNFELLFKLYFWFLREIYEALIAVKDFYLV